MQRILIKGKELPPFFAEIESDNGWKFRQWRRLVSIFFLSYYFHFHPSYLTILKLLSNISTAIEFNASKIHRQIVASDMRLILPPSCHFVWYRCHTSIADMSSCNFKWNINCNILRLQDFSPLFLKLSLPNLMTYEFSFQLNK